MLTGLLGGAVLTPHAFAADNVLKPNFYNLPAVDGVNIKADAFAGTLVSKHFSGARASITAPLMERYGAQIDLQGGRLGTDPWLSVSGHLFWRDPNVGLIGVYGSHTAWFTFGTAQVTQAAVEGEVYWGRWTLQGIVGVEFGNSIGRGASAFSTTSVTTPIPGGTSTTVTTNLSSFFEGFDVQTRFFDQINLKYYLTDNVLGYIGHRYLGGKHALAVGTEFAVPMQSRNIGSLFIEGRVGEGNFQGAWAGLRIYSGKSDKPLIRRHREDDPIVWDTLFTILNSNNSSSNSASSSATTLNCDLFEGDTPGTCETSD